MDTGREGRFIILGQPHRQDMKCVASERIGIQLGRRSDLGVNMGYQYSRAYFARISIAAYYLRTLRPRGILISSTNQKFYYTPSLVKNPIQEKPSQSILMCHAVCVPLFGGDPILAAVGAAFKVPDAKNLILLSLRGYPLVAILQASILHSSFPMFFICAPVP